MIIIYTVFVYIPQPQQQHQNVRLQLMRSVLQPKSTVPIQSVNMKQFASNPVMPAPKIQKCE